MNEHEIKLIAEGAVRQFRGWTNTADNVPRIVEIVVQAIRDGIIAESEDRTVAERHQKDEEQRIADAMANVSREENTR